MSQQVAYTYTVLRYVHDIATGEFVNVGVVLYAPSLRALKFKFRNSYSRIKRVFPDLDSKSFKSSLREIQEALEKKNSDLLRSSREPQSANALDLAASVLILDDSSLQWSPLGCGVTKSLADELDALFYRLVGKYDEKGGWEKRKDDDVWKSFSRAIIDYQILNKFEEKKISSDGDEVEFKHALRNGLWHCVAPISFDLSSSDSIIEKAHRWLGQVNSVANSKERFAVYFLVGSPVDESLVDAYSRALKILSKSPRNCEVYEEADAPKLSDFLVRRLDARGVLEH